MIDHFTLGIAATPGPGTGVNAVEVLTCFSRRTVLVDRTFRPAC